MEKRLHNNIKREFDEFASKISRLEALKHELSTLNTKGFESEANLIKASLKDVGNLNQAERDIGILREKIMERRSSSFNDDKIHDNLKSQSEYLKKKIDELEGELEEKKSAFAKSKLSGEQKSFINDIPGLEKQILELKKKFQYHVGTFKAKKEIENSIAADNKLEDFISEIKLELNQRLKKKEHDVDRKLNEDIKLHEEVFRDKYQSLVREFTEKYKEKVKSQLKREVESKFNKELSERLKEEKAKAASRIANLNIARLAIQRKKLVQKMQKEYKDKYERMEKRIRDERVHLGEEADAKRKVMLEKLKAIKRKREELQRENDKMKLKMKKEKAKLERHFFDLKKSESGHFSSSMELARKQLEQKANSYRHEINRKIHEKALESDKTKKNLMAREISRLKENLRKNFQNRVKNQNKKIKDRINILDQQNKSLSDKSKAINEKLAEERDKLQNTAIKIKQKSNQEIEDMHRELSIKEANLENLKQMAKKSLKERLDELNAKKRESDEHLIARIDSLECEKKKHEEDYRRKLLAFKKEKKLFERKSEYKLSSEKLDLHKHMNEGRDLLAKEFARVKTAENQLKKREADKAKQLSKEKLELSRKFEELKREQKQAAERKESEALAKIEKHRKELNYQFESKVILLKKKMEANLEREFRRNSIDASKKADKEIKAKEAIIKKELAREYDSKLQLEERKREAEFDEKKAILEKHVIEQAKKLFN